MTDHTTTDGDETPDEHVLRALRDVDPVPASLRRDHLDAALAEFDRLDHHGDPDHTAPVVPLRRRPATRVLQVAAAVLLVVAGVALAVRVGGGGSQHDEVSSAADSVTSASGGGLADKASAAPGSTTAVQPPSAEAGSDAAAQAVAPPSFVDLGAFSSVDDVVAVLGSSSKAVAELEHRASAGAAADGTEGHACAAPAGLGPVPELVGTATVAGERRLVWVVRDGNGAVGQVALVDPVTCERSS